MPESRQGRARTARHPPLIARSLFTARSHLPVLSFCWPISNGGSGNRFFRLYRLSTAGRIRESCHSSGY